MTKEQIEKKEAASNIGKSPFSKEEQEIIDLLNLAHEKFVKLETCHPDDMRVWVDGVHQLQSILMNRVIVRDYPEYFYNEQTANN